MKNIYSYLKNLKEQKRLKECELLVVNDDKEAKIASDIISFLGFSPFTLPDFRANFKDDLLSFKEELQDITKTLSSFYEYKKENKILISPIRTISFPLPKKECFDSFTINFADKLDLQELKEKLYNWGYYFVDIVTSEGEVSLRGDIFDIASLGSEFGYRVSLFDDEVESIRKFDIEDQKSFKDEIESFTIKPAFLALNSATYENLNEKIETISSDAFIKDIHSLGFWYLDDMATYLPQNMSSFITLNALSELDEAYIFEEKRLNKDKFLTLPKIIEDDRYKEISPSNIKEFITFHKDKKITLISSSEARVKAVDLSLDDKDIKYIFSHEIINLLSSDEVIISLNKEIKKKRKKRVKFVIDELVLNDFVVHEKHGIGVYKGIEPVTIMGAKRDFVVINYQGEDRLLIPVENLDTIDRYVADGESYAIVDKLGRGSFAKLKEKVKDRLFEIANDIIKLAAARELVNGIKIDIDEFLIKEFQSKAGFSYTKDQTRSINEIFADISSGKVMDRLLSGDVGFGKTEVAMNALLAVISSGYQAVFVCPTTLLATQHYHSISKRFKEFGIDVFKLDGKSSAKEKSSIKKGLEDGSVKFVIGTHSLLDIKTSNLALVIIDEEHKFGVKQKEKLKGLREDVHIFSMSATPIPRTLNLALSKLKGMSTLLTPPSERLGVRTFVKEYSDGLIKEIVLREKRRGGQLFYVHNNIASIEAKKKDLEKLIPNIKVDIIHSQIKPADAEKIIENFENKEFDILLATSIVESGIHLPNANSIIIDGADRFGIADLHQLRGRVGRSNKEGYCYYVVEDKSKITPEAIKRLVALESNSYLGSGTALAHQDLEIRGGGNIIGAEQSGHIKQIGYGLYLKMLEDTLAVLSGEQKDEKKSVDIKLAISAFISSDYIVEDRIRLELYRRLSRVNDTSSLYAIEEEMEDRFGKLDTPTKQFMDLILIKILAMSKGVEQISSYEMNVTFVKDGIKETIKSRSKDDDDIISATLQYLRK
ncbi:transcription-repair coupling factor [Aliarcobacter skirrowii]|uniref:Transcription-repair-coupling factor n=1 Tax=Aliarcobacter skirrowii TaxID=28200 RepID=A0A2U2C2L4_9BACT|nr:transcription-repair coupling factor [Aliarcobacter skirrowii]PWE22850.1 transcription-repair coupling factor [Aliarcobacter skirrowii]PWE23274.1 transcription-repair coupling factor [Aliarcobacter skirrowii]PWE25673.1 transcription-repair coupling factor [Aliarcobacter skirrowii]RJO56501.1 transcription-repair coupling factor [Aliarcobacter skirrowii]RJO58455.1 transcription-repair coupling factor [Aliarcobacter skirrowii]